MYDKTSMDMWPEWDFDVDSLLDPLEEDEHHTAAWRLVERYEEKRRLLRELAWYPDDTGQPLTRCDVCGEARRRHSGRKVQHEAVDT